MHIQQYTFIRKIHLQQSIVQLLPVPMVAFQERLWGKGLNLLRLLEETHVPDKYLGIFVNTSVCHEKQSIRLKQKSHFLITKSCTQPLVSLLLPRIC